MAPKLGGRPTFVVEQDGTVEVAFDAVNRTIDSMTTTAVFSYSKLESCGEIIDE